VSKDSINRKKKILNIIISEYITTATPVASDMLQRGFNLGVSSATIRNDMAILEEEGFISRPHTSAGCVPLPKGYRFYVESLAENKGLSEKEQEQIRCLFMDATDEVDRWLKLAAAMISRLVGNAAVVSIPKANKSRFKHLELVSMHDFLGLLVLVLSEATLKQQLLTFNEPVSQDRLTQIANKLNANYSGLTGSAISKLRLELGPAERLVTDAVVGIMESESSTDTNQMYLDGMKLVLSQPEFIKKERMLQIVELLEARDLLKIMLDRQTEGEKVKVLIGDESGEEALHDLSLVLGRYGVPHKLGGNIGVIGPTRMDYGRAISTVEFVSQILSYLMSEVCRTD
jgi:heat-inducible transcriptional repressor